MEGGRAGLNPDPGGRNVTRNDEGGGGCTYSQLKEEGSLYSQGRRVGLLGKSVSMWMSTLDLKHPCKGSKIEIYFMEPTSTKNHLKVRERGFGCFDSFFFLSLL